MNTKPTFDSITPREIGVFSPYQHRRAVIAHNDYERMHGRAMPPSMRKHMPLVPPMFDAPALVNTTAVAAIRKAFMLARTSKRNWQTHRRYGSLDTRAMTRAARCDQDVFRFKSGQSTTMMRVAVVLDASGSMGGQDAAITIPGSGDKVTVDRRTAAAMFGATIAQALGSVPTIMLDVWQHAASHGHVVLKWRWHRGTPLGVFNEAAQRHIGAGGNADGHALMAIAQRMKRELKRDERGLILMVSDGLPSDYAPGGTSNAGQALIDAVREARAMGIDVIAVAIDGSDQSNYYGDGMIPFDGDWMALGRTLADKIGAALADPRRR